METNEMVMACTETKWWRMGTCDWLMSGKTIEQCSKVGRVNLLPDTMMANGNDGNELNVNNMH